MSSTNYVDFRPKEELQIDLKIFHEHINKRFRKFLVDNVSDGADIIYPSCIRPILDYVAKLDILKENATSLMKMTPDLAEEYFDKEDQGFKVPSTVIFMLPGDLGLIKLMCDIIHNMRQKNTIRKIHLLIVPKRNVFLRDALEKNGVFTSLSVHDFFVDLVPLERDFLSMEIDNCFADLNFKIDYQPLQLVAESIHRLQVVFGKIPHVFAKGQHAISVLEILNTLELESRTKYEDEDYEIDAMVLLDRSADLVTPLCTQMTYHGLLDELFAIKNSKMMVPGDIIKSPNDKKEEQKEEEVDSPEKKEDKNLKPVDLSDVVFTEIRNQNFAALRIILPSKVLAIQTLLNEKNKPRDKKELSEYLQEAARVKKEYKDIIKHINISDYVSKSSKEPKFKRMLNMEQGCLVGGAPEKMLTYLEGLIGRNEPLEMVLRLFILQNQVCNGFSPKVYDFFRREIVYNYGFQHLKTFANLEKTGLLKPTEMKNVWKLLDKTLELIYEEVNNEKPNDASFAYSGYCPVSVRLVEAIFKKGGWKGIADVVQNKISGPERIADGFTLGQKPAVRNKQSILVYFVGGITLSEVSAIRYLAIKYNVEIYIATTDVITTSSFLKPFVQSIEKITEIDQPPGGKQKK